MKRKVFYSFHYEPDNWRAGQVRKIGVIEGNQPATDNDWEMIKQGGYGAIEKWISNQMRGRSCTVVLVGAQTAGRQWINYEIIQSWNAGMGVVGIHIHGLKDINKRVSWKGPNPFDFIACLGTENSLSSIVKCYDPPGDDSKEIYGWIEKYLANVVEEAISIKEKNKWVYIRAY